MLWVDVHYTVSDLAFLCFNLSLVSLISLSLCVLCDDQVDGGTPRNYRMEKTGGALAWLLLADSDSADLSLFAFLLLSDNEFEFVQPGFSEGIHLMPGQNIVYSFTFKR